MQPLSSEQAALLEGDELEISAGCEVLDLDLVVTADISDDLAGGSVSWNGFSKIHRTCRLQLSTEITWGSQLVRPYVEVGGHRWHQGVFMLTTPEKPVGEDPVTFDCQGYDRLYLLDREVADEYEVTSGTSYYDALTQAFTDAGLSGFLIDTSADDYTLPATKTWEFVGRDTSDPDQTSTPVTWLRVINDLLLAINFAGVWADENGLYRCHRYVEPSSRAAEHTFDADDQERTIVGEQRTVASDQFKAPNRWKFVWKNRPGGENQVEGDGLYTVDNVSDGPTSQDARGLIWPRRIDYEAASQDVLEELGDRRVAEDKRGTTTISGSTGPWPVAGHMDIYELVDSEAGVNGNVIAREWTLDLLGADTEWLWEVV